jgi:hypothetical protein
MMGDGPAGAWMRLVSLIPGQALGEGKAQA